MRNLKRVLSLALASAMLLGMMVIGAGAANKKASDLTDLDKVTNKDAVNLMVDLGIIVGKPDGSFAPTETIDRATMSKLIYFVLMGNTDESAFKGISTPLKDVKGNWAEGFINYCYSVNIVAGTGDNTYNPNGKVTTVSAAKMLLVALGYDPAASKYQNDAMWSVNIMRDAQTAGLLKNVGQKANENLTRDNAAQMIYNALFANTVTPKYSYDMGNKYIDEYRKGETLGYETYSLVKVTGTVTSLTADGKANFTATTPAGLLTHVSGKVVANGDMLGKTGVIYVKATKNVDNAGVVTYTFDKIYSSTASVGASVILGTSTNGTALRDNTWSSGDKDLTSNKSDNKGFIAELELAANGTDHAVSVFKDGAPVTPTAITVAGFALPAAVNTAIAKKGTVVELIDSNSNGRADIIKITEKTVYTLSADAATKVVDKETQVRVPGVTGLTNFTAANTTKNVKGYEDLKKGDVVLVNLDASGVYFIEKAAVIEGTVSSVNSDGEPRIGGTYYKSSNLAGATNDWGSVALADKDWVNVYKFYLDNGNNIVKTVKVTDEEVAGTNTVLLATKWIGGDLSTGGYLQGKLLLTDGSTQVVRIAKFDGKTPIDATPGANQVVVTAAADNKFYTYTVNSNGYYELKLVTKDLANLAGATVDNNKTQFDGTNLASANTIFVVEVTDTNGAKTYKSYTGIANVPSMSGIAAGDRTGKILVKDGIATVVFVKVADTGISGIDRDAVYFYVPDYTDYSYVPKTTANPSAYYEYVAYKDGSKTTVKLSNQIAVGDTNKLWVASTATAEGVYTNAAVIIAGSNVELSPNGVKVANGGTLQLNTGSKVFKYDDATQVYYINTDNELSVGTLKVDANDDITVIYGSNNLVKVVFIREVTSSATGFTAQPQTTIDGIDKGTAAVVASAAVTGAVADAPAVTVAAQGKVKLVVTGLPAGAKLTSVTGEQALVAATTAYNFTVVVTAEDGTIQTCVVTVTFAGVTAS